MKLNVFYHNVSENLGCGDWRYYGWILITPKSYDEIVARMREYAKENKGKFFHGGFLESCGDIGLYANTEDVPDFYGDMLGEEHDIGNIKEEDLYSKDDMADILRQREEERKQKLEKERLEREQRQRERDEAEFERLKQKLNK